MDVKEKIYDGFGRARKAVDANQDGNVSGAEVRKYAEDEVRERPLQSMAIVAALTAVGVVALFALYLLTR